MYDTIFNPERTNSSNTNPLNPPPMNSISDIDYDKKEIQAVDKDESFRSFFWGSEGNLAVNNYFTGVCIYIDVFIYIYIYLFMYIYVYTISICMI
jgi:hypothetical protein